MKSQLKGKSGFTLVEIMIVVAIIGILVAIAVPNFIRARERTWMNSCIANMKTIEGATIVAQLDSVALSDIGDLVGGYLTVEPECPADGEYAYHPDLMDGDDAAPLIDCDYDSPVDNTLYVHELPGGPEDD